MRMNDIVVSTFLSEMEKIASFATLAFGGVRGVTSKPARSIIKTVINPAVKGGVPAVKERTRVGVRSGFRASPITKGTTVPPVNERTVRKIRPADSDIYGATVIEGTGAMAPRKGPYKAPAPQPIAARSGRRGGPVTEVSQTGKKPGFFRGFLTRRKAVADEAKSKAYFLKTQKLVREQQNNPMRQRVMSQRLPTPPWAKDLHKVNSAFVDELEKIASLGKSLGTKQEGTLPTFPDAKPIVPFKPKPIGEQPAFRPGPSPLVKMPGVGPFSGSRGPRPVSLSTNSGAAGRLQAKYPTGPLAQAVNKQPGASQPRFSSPAAHRVHHQRLLGIKPAPQPGAGLMGAQPGPPAPQRGAIGGPYPKGAPIRPGRYSLSGPPSRRMQKPGPGPKKARLFGPAYNRQMQRLPKAALGTPRSTNRYLRSRGMRPLKHARELRRIGRAEARLKKLQGG